MLCFITHKTKRSIALTIFFFIFNAAYAHSPYSNKELEQLEKEFIEQINHASNIIRTPLANQYINALGRKLAINGQMHSPHFFIIKSSEINAFAGPGGHIGINSQLILASDDESELAGVMAHEMAHVRQHHLYRMIEHEKHMQIPRMASMLAAIALGVINPGLGSGALMASMSGFAQDSINYIRSNEKEADSIGIDMLIKSGINPKGMAAFFKKMQGNARYYYDNVPAILKTHPIDNDRIAESENRTAHLPNKNYADSLDYHLFKEIIRVAVSGNGRKLFDYYQHRCYQKTLTNSCSYGYVLALNEHNKYSEALNVIAPLQKGNPNNLFYSIALSETYIGLKRYKESVALMRERYKNAPDNYAVTAALANSLLADQKAAEAASILLKATRIFKNDLALCERLSRAQAESHQKAYAYFTEAHCQLIQGQKKIALHQLKLAKKLAKNNAYLLARIDAKVEDIKRDY